MSLKKRFVIEIVLLSIIFSLLPLVWRQFTLGSVQKYSSSTEMFLETLLDMPPENIPFKDKPFKFYETEPLPNTAFKLQNLSDGTVEYKWAEDNQNIYLTIDPNFNTSSKFVQAPTLFRIILSGGPGSETIKKVPTKIIKDARALSAINTLATDNNLTTWGTFESLKFNQEADGLKEISVSGISDPGSVGQVEWNFLQEKVPNEISQSATRFKRPDNFINIFFPHPLVFFNTDFVGFQFYGVYILSTVVLILLPIIILSVIAYLIANKLFVSNTLLRINLHLIPLGLILYPVYYRTLGIILTIIFRVPD